MHYIPLSFPSVSHVYSSAELSLFNCKNTGALHLSDLSFWIPSIPQTQPWFLCDSLTIHQSRKDLHEQRVSGLHHPKGSSSVSHSLLILVQSNWVDWTPVLVWSMRQTESRLKMIGRGLWVRMCCLTEDKKRAKTIREIAGLDNKDCPFGPVLHRHECLAFARVFMPCQF